MTQETTTPAAATRASRVARLLRALKRRPRLFWLASAAVLLMSLGVAVYASLPPPQVQTNLRATAERIQMRVVSPEFAAQRISGMRLIDASGAKGRCVDGLVMPRKGARITLLGAEPDGSAMRIEAADGVPEAAVILGEDGAAPPLTGVVDFKADKGCPGAMPRRFAIHGVAQFGHEFQPAKVGRDVASGYLTDATLNVFLHATKEILWIFKPKPRIYKVESMELPGGARISADAGANGEEPTWRGIAEVDKDSGRLHVDASTNAPVVRVILAGSPTPDAPIVMGDFYRIAHDPNLFWLFALLPAALAVALAILGELAKQVWAWLARPVAEPVSTSTADSPPAPPDRTSVDAARVAPAAPSAAPAGLALVVAALLLGGADMARGEPVRIRNGAQGGQGWMFADADGVCRIVTAAHVLRRGDVLIAPSVEGRAFSGVPTSDPMQPDPEMDVAFLVARPSFPCPEGELHASDLGRRLAVPFATLDPLGATAQQTVRLARRALETGPAGVPQQLVFEHDGGPPLAKGMSGAAVLDAQGRPLGLFIGGDAEGRLAHAIRIDVVAMLLAARVRPSRRAESSIIAGWSLVHGRNADPARSIDKALAGGGGWSVETKEGHVVFDLRLRAPRKLASIAFRVDARSAAGLGSVSLYAPAAGVDGAVASNWPGLATCPPAPGLRDVLCDFRARQVDRIRVHIRSTAARMEIEELRFGVAK